MAGHGNKRHMKRIAAKPYPRISKKAAKYLAKPGAGRHSIERSVAILVVLRDKLGLVSNKTEAKKVLALGKVQVNGKVVKDEKYPLGFGDILKVTDSGDSYRIGIAKDADIRIEKNEGGDERTLKVVGKYLAKGNKVMVRLYDGSSLQGNGDVRVNDSVILSGSKIKQVLKLKQGVKCLVVEGTHASETGTVKGIEAGGATSVATVEIEGENGTFKTPVKNVMVVGA